MQTVRLAVGAIHTRRPINPNARNPKATATHMLTAGCGVRDRGDDSAKPRFIAATTNAPRTTSD